MLFPNSMQPSLSNSGPPTIPVMNSIKNNFGTMLVYKLAILITYVWSPLQLVPAKYLMVSLSITPSLPSVPKETHPSIIDHPIERDSSS